jgi:hypothetical protein
MKAEERKHLHQNEFATGLKNAWQTIASGSTVNTIVWGVILLGLVLAIGWRYYSDATFKSRSALWSQLESANDTEELQKIIKDHPGTMAARVARFHLARWQTENALGRVAGPSTEDKAKAAGELEDALNAYAELAKERLDEPTLVQEAMMGVATAEEVLAGIPKADSNQPRGSLEKAREAYEALATKYPQSFLGEKAAKRAKELADHATQIRGFYDSLLEVHGKPAAPPVPPLPTPPLSEAPKASATGPVIEAPKPTPPPALKPGDKGAVPPPPAAAPKEEAKPKAESKAGGEKPNG